ncbi:carboxypeptidase-like regulatory domain-containing protein [Polyangium sorediatum]|uniref:Carboxypeptidase-like regulatory domain-containing protein n=1 Tax=Polyangium sorediatum TaxID=889274 RepID=A0ABT6NUL2_9BACT|nr:carboxypeptidase-like regulatory domain-containing protein [Polyangium sorediatum]MDI1432021.1 carboxypeptidase-like regulatory domain-containing protein [Polyangium sorediatum]
MKRAFSLTSSLFLLTAVPALSGCFALGGADAEAVNACSSDEDCEGGGVCASVDGFQTCVGTKVDLPGLILEVRPTAEANTGANTPYLVPFGGEGFVAQSSAGLVVDHDIALSHVVVSPIELFVDYDYKGCPLSPEGKLQADFTFYRDAQHAGLPDHEAKAVIQPGSTDAYSVEIPPGIYDVHVVPRAPENCPAPPPPPMYYRGIDVSQGGKIDLHLSAAPRLISGSIAFPEGKDLNGWSIEVVEPKHGIPVSRTQVLTVDPPFALFTTYNLEYYWDFGLESSPILRLRPPPDDPDAPKFFWQVASLSPLNPDSKNIQADLTLIDLDAVGRSVMSTVVDAHGAPVVATVSFRSLELSGNASNSAIYSAVVDTDTEGRFTVLLPPGKYRVTTHPTFDLTKAVTTEDGFEVPADGDCVCGKGFTVRDKSVVSGEVVLPNGSPLSFGSASVFPSRTPARPYLSRSLLADAPASQPMSTPLGFAGEFSLLADPGLADLVVVPPSDSLYPWIANPQVKILVGQPFDFNTLVLPYPVVLRGEVRDPLGKIVPNATVRAWMPVTASGTEETVVIQIAEGATDFAGRYKLPLAPSLALSR